MKIKREKCPWELIGENTAGGIYWCSHCGSVVDEDGTNLSQPAVYEPDSSDAHEVCPDIYRKK